MRLAPTVPPAAVRVLKQLGPDAFDPIAVKKASRPVSRRLRDDTRNKHVREVDASLDHADALKEEAGIATHALEPEIERSRSDKRIRSASTAGMKRATEPKDSAVADITRLTQTSIPRFFLLVR